MSEVVPFDFEGHEVRTNVRDDGEVLFARADVCAVLWIVDARQATERLEEDERGVFTTHPPNGRTVELAAVTKAGLTHKGLTELHRRLGGTKSLAAGQLSAVPAAP